jgi:hypothetical protein
MNNFLNSCRVPNTNNVQNANFGSREWMAALQCPANAVSNSAMIVVEQHVLTVHVQI